MNLRSIIEEIANQADDFLEGASNRAEARAGVNELINADYLELGPADRKIVADGVMRILEQEGFFDHAPGENEGDEADESEEE
ncbi:hypothetical protein MASR2M8_12900 [Opitutaceae bacterium]